MRLRSAFTIFAVYCASVALFSLFHFSQPHALALASATTLTLVLGASWWHYGRYIHFSLGALLLAIVTLQVPIALLVNPWGLVWAMPVGGALLLIWLCAIYLFVVERALHRWVREKSLQKLKADETKGIGKL